MNSFVFYDAISNLDTKMLEDHFQKRKQVIFEHRIKTRLKQLKISISIACFLILSAINYFFIKVMQEHVNSNVYIESISKSMIFELPISLIITIILGLTLWKIGKKAIIKKSTRNSNEIVL